MEYSDGAPPPPRPRSCLKRKGKWPDPGTITIKYRNVQILPEQTIIKYKKNPII